MNVAVTIGCQASQVPTAMLREIVAYSTPSQVIPRTASEGTNSTKISVPSNIQAVRCTILSDVSTRQLMASFLDRSKQSQARWQEDRLGADFRQVSRRQPGRAPKQRFRTSYPAESPTCE